MGLFYHTLEKDKTEFLRCEIQNGLAERKDPMRISASLALLVYLILLGFPQQCGAQIRTGFFSPLVKSHLRGEIQIVPSWTISTATGETESVQLAVEAMEGSGDQTVSVETEVPEGTPFTVELHLVGFVETVANDRRPWAKEKGVGYVGWWPDPLLPNRPFQVAAGETQPVWVNVVTPRGAAPGTYPFRLKVRAGSKHWNSECKVVIWPAEVPREQYYRNAAFLPPGNLSAYYRPEGGITGNAFFALYKRWVRKAFSQHLGPTFDMMMGWNGIAVRTPETSGPLGPTAEMISNPASGALVWPVLGTTGNYDFRRVDELGAIGREYGMRQYAIAIFDRERSYSQMPQLERDQMAGLLRAYAGHLREQGRLHEAYVYNVDEPPQKQWDTVKENYRFVKSVVPDLNTWLCLNQPKAVQELSPFTDVLDVYIRQYDSSRAEAVRQSGKQVIWAVCVWPHEHPNLFIEYPGADARAIGWLTYRYGISGFEYWGLNQWGGNVNNRDWANFAAGDTRTRWKRTKWPWGDGWLLYPGPDGEPLSSVRFENLRDGFEEAELLQVLAARGAKAQADALATKLTPSIEGYSTDPARYAEARLELLKLVSETKPPTRQQ